MLCRSPRMRPDRTSTLCTLEFPTGYGPHRVAMAYISTPEPGTFASASGLTICSPQNRTQSSFISRRRRGGTDTKSQQCEPPGTSALSVSGIDHYLFRRRVPISNGLRCCVGKYRQHHRRGDGPLVRSERDNWRCSPPRYFQDTPSLFSSRHNSGVWIVHLSLS